MSPEFLLRRYVPGPGTDMPIAMVQSSGVRSYFHANRQGSTIAMSSDTGTLSEGPYTYDAYGNGAPTTGVPFKYTGRRLDSLTGFYYYRARYYLPGIGRFAQTDPVGYGDQMNLYAYVNNDPTNATDPTGEIIDTVADVGFILYDLYRISEEGLTDENAAALGADVVAAVVPGVTGAGLVVRGAKAIDKSTDTIKITKAAADKGPRKVKEKAKDRRERQRQESKERKHGDKDYKEPASEKYAKDKAKKLKKKVEGTHAGRVTTKRDRGKEIGAKNSSMRTMTKRRSKVLSKSEKSQWDSASHLLDSGKYAEALSALDILLVVKRDLPKLYAHRGYAFYRLEKYANAARDFEEAIELEPGAQNTLFLLGRCYEEIEEFDQAIKIYKRVVALNDDTADAHAHMGFCFEQLERLEEARAAYEAALKRDPDESLALAGLKELRRAVPSELRGHVTKST